MTDFELIVEIVKRSEDMVIGDGDRITRVLDIEFANEKFNLRLEEFLKASDVDFTHDFCGIQARIDRQNKVWNDDMFIPRFAK